MAGRPPLLLLAFPCSYSAPQRNPADSYLHTHTYSVWAAKQEPSYRRDLGGIGGGRVWNNPWSSGGIAPRKSLDWSHEEKRDPSEYNLFDPFLWRFCLPIWSAIYPELHGLFLPQTHAAGRPIDRVRPQLARRSCCWCKCRWEVVVSSAERRPWRHCCRPACRPVAEVSPPGSMIILPYPCKGGRGACMLAKVMGTAARFYLLPYKGWVNADLTDSRACSIIYLLLQIYKFVHI